MIYFFLNVVAYLVVIMLLVFYFHRKMNIYSFIIILFNLNISFFLIYQDESVILSMLVAIFSVFLYQFFMLFKESDEVILIKNGNINFHALIKNYSYFKLISYLKIRRIRLDEIAYCILKNNHLTIIKNKSIASYPVSLIIDGKILKENLTLIKKDESWLKEELLKNNLLVKMVDYAYFKKNKVYFIKG